eukprot:scaffold319013_cov18-Tisochrysis_lutea.AAC.1
MAQQQGLSKEHQWHIGHELLGERPFWECSESAAERAHNSNQCLGVHGDQRESVQKPHRTQDCDCTLSMNDRSGQEYSKFTAHLLNVCAHNCSGTCSPHLLAHLATPLMLLLALGSWGCSADMLVEQQLHLACRPGRKADGAESACC